MRSLCFLFIITSSFSLNAQRKKESKLQVSFKKNIEFLGFTFFLGSLGDQYINSNDEYDTGVKKQDWHAYNLLIYKEYTQFKNDKNLAIITMYNESLHGSTLLKLLLQLRDFPNAAIDSTIPPELFAAFDKQHPESAKAAAQRFITALNEFYKTTDFDTYFVNHKHHYEYALQEINRNLPTDEFIREMEKFYRTKFFEYNLIPSLTIPCGMGFATSIQESAGTKIFNAFGGYSQQKISDLHRLSMGFDDPKQLIELSIHEFGHSFVNHTLIELSVEAVLKSEPLFSPIKVSMVDQGYTTWRACVDEHLVRAGEIMISRKLNRKNEAEGLYQEYKVNRKFIYIDFVIAELEWYQQDKTHTYKKAVDRILQRLILETQKVSPVNSLSKHSDSSTHFHTSDIDLFWKVFDKTYPEIKGDILQNEYLALGSSGLHAFINNRIESGKHLSKVIKDNLAYYEFIRESSLSIANKKELFHKSFTALKAIYPEAVFPDVYFVIGAKNSGGTTFDRGLIIGAEMFGEANAAIQAPLTIDLVDEVVAHELTHFQQKYAKDNSLLAQSIREGSADFIAELIAGSHSNKKMYEYGDAHEKELWGEFSKRMYDNDWTNWLYYQKDKSRPKDLGYWMGYKITKAYYDKALDKSLAIHEILNIQDFKSFLEKSGYQ